MEKIRETFINFAADTTVWASSHAKQIVISVGLGIFGFACYKIGYKRGEQDCFIRVVNEMISVAEEKAGWTK